MDHRTDWSASTNSPNTSKCRRRRSMGGVTVGSVRRDSESVSMSASGGPISSAGLRIGSGRRPSRAERQGPSVVSYPPDSFESENQGRLIMAHIRRHPKAKDRWQVRYVDPSGKERAKNFSRKSDAERFLVSIETDKLRGIGSIRGSPRRLSKSGPGDGGGLHHTSRPTRGMATRACFGFMSFHASLRHPWGASRPLTSENGWQTSIVRDCRRRESGRRTSCWHRFFAQLSNRVTWQKTHVSE